MFDMQSLEDLCTRGLPDDNEEALESRGYFMRISFKAGNISGIIYHSASPPLPQELKQLFTLEITSIIPFVKCKNYMDRL